MIVVHCTRLASSWHVDNNNRIIRTQEVQSSQQQGFEVFTTGPPYSSRERTCSVSPRWSDDFDPDLLSWQTMKIHLSDTIGQKVSIAAQYAFHDSSIGTSCIDLEISCDDAIQALGLHHTVQWDIACQHYIRA